MNLYIFPFDLTGKDFIDGILYYTLHKKYEEEL